MLLVYSNGVSRAFHPLPLDEKELLLCMGKSGKPYAKAEIQEEKQVSLSKTYQYRLNTPPSPLKLESHVTYLDLHL